MLDKEVWTPVHNKDINKNGKIIPSKLFLKEKYNPEGAFEKLKARLVAGGHKQNRDLYTEEEISSPTMATQSVFMITAIAAEEEREVATGDIPGAYLHADMSGDIYIVLPEDISAILIKMDNKYKDYVNNNGTIIVKLLKALYGCVESAKLWYEHLRARLEEMEFKPNPIDICVFNKQIGNNQCTIGIYVDDLIITAKDLDIIERTTREIDYTFDGILWTWGTKHNYLGMTFTFNKESKTVNVAMNKYIEELMVKYKVSGKSKTPCGNDLFDIDEKSILLTTEEKEAFHSAVASILFLAKRSRPDLLLTVSFLSTRVNEPTDQDHRKLDKLLRYINSTKHFYLTIDAKNVHQPWISIDASYAAHHDKKGHTGVVEGLGTGCFNFKSSKQKTVSKSSTEAEILGVSDGLSLALYTRQFLHHQGYELSPTILYQDNLSSIQMLKSGKGNSDRTKHIDVRNFWIKNQLELGTVILEYMSTDKMISDILTKPITGKHFIELRNKLLSWNK